MFKTIILATKITNNGLINSTGWNLGRGWKSSHLLDPLISTPTIRVKKRSATDNINKYVKILINLFFSWTEIIKIKSNERETKIKCLIKKKYVSLFILSDITEVVEENEKNNPNNKSNTNKNLIYQQIIKIKD